MKILVTGAAGFIGFHVVRRLIERGDSVVGLDNINDYYDVRLKYGRLAATGIPGDLVRDGTPVASSTHPNYRFVKQDIKDRGPLGRLFEQEGFTKVCHLAAQAGVRYSLENPYAYVESNLVGFVNLIELCRRHEAGHFVYASSSSVYGTDVAMPFTTEARTDRPVSLYGATKKCDEVIAHSYSHMFGLPTTGLRFFTVYGPWGRPDMACFIFTAAILSGRPIEVFNHGDMERDFTYIDDIVEGIVRVLDKPPQPQRPYGLYNIGHGSPVGLMDFIEAIERALGRKALKIMRPMQPGDMRSTWADTGGLLRDFGYQPSVPVQTGIDRFIEWYRDYHNL